MARTDVEDAFAKLGHLLKTATPKAITAARKAAADVYVRAATHAAPVQSGQLKKSIKVIKGRADAYGEYRLYVGPEKKTGYYGRFVEKGHKTAGRHRVKRKGSKTAHNQDGVITQKQVAARPWFEPAIKSVEKQAQDAAETAFCRIMKQKGL